MPRMLDLDCHACNHQIRDQFFMEVPDEFPCPKCGAKMDRAWYLPRRERTEWDMRDAVVVFKKSDGSISYPGRNDSPTPQGCERVVMRSLRAVEKFEREHGVKNEAVWFDKGSGRGFDDTYRDKRMNH